MNNSLCTILFFVALGGAAIGCSKKDKESEAPAKQSVAAAPDDQGKPAAADEPAQEEKPAAPATDAAAAATDPATHAATATGEGDFGVWDEYWPAFQKAASSKDMEALKGLVLIGDELDQGTFEMLGDTFLTKEVIETLGKTEAASVKAQEGTEGADEVREFSWSETAVVDGEEMGSALFFYFKKVDGKYKLFRLLAAG